MHRLLSVLLLIFLASSSQAQNFGNIPPQTVLGNPSTTAKQPAQPIPFTNLNAHVATNAALAAASTASYPSGVWRDDYSAGLGAPPLWFKPGIGPCASQTPPLTNDGGSCTNDSSGNSFIAVFNTAVSVKEWGAVCDGSTDDSTAFTNALAVTNVSVPPGLTCRVKDLTLNSRSIYANGSTLKLAAGGSWVVNLTGTNPALVNTLVNDADGNALHSTTLSGTASPGATTVTVTSATGFVVGNPILVTLDSGERHATVISTVAGTTIGLQDPIPSSAIVAAVNNGGAGCSAGDTFAINTGIGLPIVLSATTVDGGGTLNAAPTVQTHGQYTTTPTTTASTVSKGATNHCTTLPTFDLTVSGATSGNAVKTAYPLIRINDAFAYNVENSQITKSSIGMGLTGTSTNGTIANLYAVASELGFYNTGLQGVGSFSDWKIYSDPSPWAWGIMVNGVAGAVFANAYSNIAVLGGHGGIICRRCKSHQFTARTVVDTVQYYGMAFLGGDRNTLTGGELTFTTGSVNDLVNGLKGVGLVIGNAETNFVIDGGLQTRINAVDIYRESATTWGLDVEMWRTSRVLGGSGAPTAGANCSGTGTAIMGASTRASGSVQLGATGTITTCSITFNSGYPADNLLPNCQVSGINLATSTFLDLFSTNVTGIIIRLTPGVTAGGKIFWRCNKGLS